MARAKKFFIACMLLLCAALALVFGYAPARIDASRNGVSPHDRYPVSTQADALHDSLLIGDWHADSLLWTRDLTRRNAHGHVDFPRLREGNVALQVFTAVTKSPAGQNYEHNSASTRDNITMLAVVSGWPPKTWGDLTERALYQAETMRGFVDEEGDDALLIREVEDLDALLHARAAGSETVGVLLGLEGAHALERDLANVDRLEDAGFRVIGLHHFFDNALGTSLHGGDEGGLTEFGREVVQAVAERGMVLDLAHSSPAVVQDVLDSTDIPLVISHTGLHSHCGVTRNLADPLMVAVAETGGTIGFGFWSDVICTGDSPGDVASMLAAAVDVLGEDHVSLGSDFDGSVRTGFDSSELRALTHALLEEGLTAPQIAKIMGGNMLRVVRRRLRTRTAQPGGAASSPAQPPT